MVSSSRGNWIFLLVGLLAVACCAFAFSLPSLPRAGSESVTDVAVLEDRAGTLGPEAARARDAAGHFTPLPAPTLSRGMTGSAFWLRFRIAGWGRGDGEADRYLVLGNPNLEMLDLYLPVVGPDGRRHYRHDALGQFPAERGDHLETLEWTVRLPRSLDRSAPVYLRVRSTTIVTLPLAVTGAGAVVKRSVADIFGYGLLFGFLVAMVMYNILSLLIVRDRPRVFYTLYLVSTIAYQVKINGLANLLGLPVACIRVLVWSSLACVGSFFILFARSFLDTRRKRRTIDRLLVALLAVFVLQAVVGIAGFDVTANRIAHLSGLATPLVILVAALGACRAGFTPARLYLIGWTCLFTGAFIWSFAGFVPVRLPWNWFFLGGTALESVFSSLAINRSIRLMMEEKKRIAERERIFRQLAQTDGLTGLYNKRCFAENAAGLCESAKAASAGAAAARFSVVMLDLDNLKGINDSFGHQTGDAVLRALAGTITAHVRRSDIPCRFGGDEFAVLLPGATRCDAASAAGKIRERLAAMRFDDGSGGRFAVTASIGLAEAGPEDTPESLMDRADRALYAAKTGGRNRVVEG